MKTLTRSDIYLVKIRRRASNVNASIKEKVYVNANSADEAAKQIYSVMNPSFIMTMEVKKLFELDHCMIQNDDIPSFNP